MKTHILRLKEAAYICTVTELEDQILMRHGEAGQLVLGNVNAIADWQREIYKPYLDDPRDFNVFASNGLNFRITLEQRKLFPFTEKKGKK